MSAGGPTPGAYAPPEDLARLQSNAWLVGGAGAVLSLVGAWTDTARFLQSYLVAWLFLVGIALGCFGLMMLHHLSRGGWGLMIRRVLEAASRTLPFLGLAFLPVLLRLDHVYLWARPEAVAADELLAGKVAYLNQPFFIARTVFYFAVWSFFAWLLSRLSLRQDRTGDPALFRRMQALAGPAIGIYALTATFAAVDWIMSLDPHWFSSLFGIYFIGGHAVAAFAFVVPVALYLSAREPMSKLFRPIHFQDYGKLMLAFVMLWAYFALSQLLIIWSGNLTEEIGWYLERAHGGWKYVSIALALFHFALPFLLLLSRDLKRSSRRLAVVAAILLVMRWFDLYWQAAPVFSPGGLAFHWLDLATVVGLGGVWFALFVGQLRGRSLVPIHDPYLEEALAHE